jgi:hypothetical protein
MRARNRGPFSLVRQKQYFHGETAPAEGIFPIGGCGAATGGRRSTSRSPCVKTVPALPPDRRSKAPARRAYGAHIWRQNLTLGACVDVPYVYTSRLAIMLCNSSTIYNGKCGIDDLFTTALHPFPPSPPATRSAAKITGRCANHPVENWTPANDVRRDTILVTQTLRTSQPASRGTSRT